MKICFLSCEYGPSLAGGEGVVTQSLAESLLAAGHEVRVAGLLERGSKWPRYEELNGIPVHRVPIPFFRGGGVLARYRLFRLVRGWAMAGDIDLVETPLARGLAAGWSALPVPVVVRIHGTRAARTSPWEPPPSPVSRWFEHAAAKRADVLCAVSNSVAHLVTHRLLESPRPCTVIPNPIRGFGAAAAWQPTDPPTIVYSGGLIERKGVCELIRVWARVHHRFPNAKLLLFGRDSNMHTGCAVSAWIHDFLRNPEQLGVQICGHVPRTELAQAYRRAAAVVLPSHYEAFGMAAAEAMWCGCPLVFTQYGSGPELVEDGVEGLLVNPHQPDSIAEALLRILLDPEWGASLGHAAARKARSTFDAERALRLNLAFYEQCCQQFGAQD
jgi:glycosyltransferase involved in cell wall biosynthesis